MYVTMSYRYALRHPRLSPGADSPRRFLRAVLPARGTVAEYLRGTSHQVFNIPRTPAAPCRQERPSVRGHILADSPGC